MTVSPITACHSAYHSPHTYWLFSISLAQLSALTACIAAERYLMIRKQQVALCVLLFPRPPPKMKKVAAQKDDDYLAGLDLPPSEEEEEEYEKKEFEKGPLMVQVSRMRGDGTFGSVRHVCCTDDLHSKGMYLGDISADQQSPGGKAQHGTNNFAYSAGCLCSEMPYQH